MTRFNDVPLPGLELYSLAQESRGFTRRPYDASLVPSAAVIDRFWSHVVISPHCWIWTGAISSPDGYGRITWRQSGSQRTMSTHRFALLLDERDHPGEGDAVAEHRCNEPLCVRVDDMHVIRSTQRANLDYAVSLGRAGAHRITDDTRSRVQRSRDVRDALRDGWDPIAYGMAAGETTPSQKPTLF